MRRFKWSVSPFQYQWGHNTEWMNIQFYVSRKCFFFLHNWEYVHTSCIWRNPVTNQFQTFTLFCHKLYQVFLVFHSDKDKGPRRLMKKGITLILVGHINFILGAIVHGSVLRHISKPSQHITTEYTVANIISVTSGLLVSQQFTHSYCVLKSCQQFRPKRLQVCRTLKVHILLWNWCFMKKLILNSHSCQWLSLFHALEQQVYSQVSQVICSLSSLSVVYFFQQSRQNLPIKRELVFPISQQLLRDRLDYTEVSDKLPVFNDDDDVITFLWNALHTIH